MKQLRYFFVPSDARLGQQHPIPLLSVSQYQGVVLRSQLTDLPPRAESFEKYKTCQMGDLVLNRFNAYRGSLGVAKLNGIVSPDYLVLRPIRAVDSKFFEYFLRTDVEAAAMLIAMGGIGANDPDTSGFSRIDVSTLLRRQVAQETYEEQQEIATFLDHETAQIDDLVAKQERLIELLGERRQAVISRAVTRGLHEGVSLKDSGVEWLGDIPAHWSVAPLKFLVSERKRKNRGGIEENLLSLSYGRVVRKDINSNDGLLPGSFDGYNIVSEGDIVLRLTDLQNDQRSLRSGLVRERGIITSAYVTITPGDFDPQYLDGLFRALDIKKVFYTMGSGLRQSLTFDELGKLLLLVPPVEEQREIAAYLDRETAQIDALVLKSRTMIDLLKERRQALISAAVTGKLAITAEGRAA